MNDAKLHSLDAVANRLGISRSWLRKEADAGRIPFVRIGRRRVCDVDAVRSAIVQRSEHTGSAGLRKHLEPGKINGALPVPAVAVHDTSRRSPRQEERART